jgi:hypothetical protein
MGVVVHPLDPLQDLKERGPESGEITVVQALQEALRQLIAQQAFLVGMYRSELRLQ